MQKCLRKRNIPTGKHSNRCSIDETNGSLNDIFDALHDNNPSARPKENCKDISPSTVSIEYAQLDNAKDKQGERYCLPDTAGADHGNATLP